MQYSYIKIDIRISIYMNGMAAVKRIGNIEKGIRDCAKIEKERKIMSELKKTKYMILNTGKEKGKMVNAKSRTVQKTEIYQSHE